MGPKRKEEDAVLEEAALVERFHGFLTQQYQSLLKAWRRVLDPHREGELFFSEFIEALARMGWQGDTSTLWNALVKRTSAKEGVPTLRLQEVSPTDYAYIKEFQDWTIDSFGGAVDMFNSMTADEPNCSISAADFKAACLKPGCQVDIDKIFREALDLDGIGEISVSDVAFLEVDALKQRAAVDPSFVMRLDAAKAAAKKMRRRGRLQRKVQQSALRDFRRKVRAASGGSFIRGWRAILDSDGNLAVSKTEMLKGCRQIAFVGDMVALWKSLDVDDDGTVHLQEADVRMALVLATFKKWASEHFGSCVNLLQHLSTLTKRRATKWNRDDFDYGLRLVSFPGVPGMQFRQATAMLHEAFDLSDCGFITSQDVTFLDKWEPTPWLMADPDFQERDRFIAALRGRYVNLIVAWRRMLDCGNRNCVSYKDFSNACRLLRVQNAPGVWRALDTTTSGFISLKEIDQASADTLSDFKEWAESTFGTIQCAFQVLDTKGENSLSLPLFKRVLRDFRFQGDARTLFQSLKPVTGNAAKDVRITLEDMRYLSSWNNRNRSQDTFDASSDDDKGGEHSRQSSQVVQNPNARDIDPSVRQSLQGHGVAKTSSTHLRSTGRNEKRVGSVLPSASSRPSQNSDQFVYCRSSTEHMFFTLSKTAGGMPKQRRWHDIDRRRGLAGFSSPYEIPLWPPPGAAYEQQHRIARTIPGMSSRSPGCLPGPVANSNSLNNPALMQIPPGTVAVKPLGLARSVSLPALSRATHACEVQSEHDRCSTTCQKDPILAPGPEPDVTAVSSRQGSTCSLESSTPGLEYDFIGPTVTT